MGKLKKLWPLGCLFGPIILGVGFGALLFAGFVGMGKGGENSFTGSTETTDSLDGLTLPATSGKLGHEEHLSLGVVLSYPQPNACIVAGQLHYVGTDSYPLGSADGCGAFGGGMTSDQERWYFNMRWDYGDRKDDFRHKKIILANPEKNKKIVVSIEDYGPGLGVIERDGINCGAPPEVYNYLGTENPYTGDPSDKQGLVLIGFAKDQSIPLGPLK